MNGKRIRSWMKKRGISQRDLARLVDVHETTVSRVLAGTRKPSPQLALRLAKEMGVPMETFFQGARS